MKKCFSWSLVCILITSIHAPYKVNAAEVLSAVDSLSNSPHIRALAASCAACHGTNGNSAGITPTLAGLDDGYFITQMLAFKDGSRPSTVMHHHARGLNIDEINLLANYFASQKRVTSQLPKTEPLKASDVKNSHVKAPHE
jgi:cytochrome subunit of sulfide dehydrogenase